MVSFEVRRTRGAALVLALVAWLPDTASAQSASSVDEQRQAVAEQIEEALTQGGPYSKELVDPLTSLAELYDQSGNHDLAAAATEQAMQVIRANYGLRSLDQAPLIRERMRSEEERGNAEEAWRLEQALLTLARANLADVRSAEIFAEAGDKRMDVLRRYLSGERPPQLALGCYYSYYEWLARPPPGNENYPRRCSSGSRRVATRALLVDAQRNQMEAIGVLFRAEQFASPELRDLEHDLIRSTYSYGGNYETGRDSLRRLMAYAVANAEPMVSRAAALLQVADWDLLYDHRPTALAVYEATYGYLKRDGAEPAAMDSLFSPLIPVMLPASEPNPLASPPSTEHIDISFEITRYGVSERVNVLAKTANVSDEAEEWLVQLIEQRRFRPRVVDGVFPRSALVQVRYYPYARD